MAGRRFRGYDFRRVRYGNFGVWWLVTVAGGEQSFRTRKALIDFLRTLPQAD